MSKCKPCDAEKAARYYAANRAKKAAYDAAKSEEVAAKRAATRKAAEAIYGGACTWCGATADLEFDHLDDDGGDHRETENPSQMFRRIVASGERLPDRRVRLLCVPCHRGPGWRERRAQMDAEAAGV